VTFCPVVGMFRGFQNGNHKCPVGSVVLSNCSRLDRIPMLADVINLIVCPLALEPLNTEIIRDCSQETRTVALNAYILPVLGERFSYVILIHMYRLLVCRPA